MSTIFLKLPVYSFSSGIFTKTSDMFIVPQHVVALSISVIDSAFCHVQLSNGNVIICRCSEFDIPEDML